MFLWAPFTNNVSKGEIAPYLPFCYSGFKNYQSGQNVAACGKGLIANMINAKSCLFEKCAQT